MRPAAMRPGPPTELVLLDDFAEAANTELAEQNRPLDRSRTPLGQYGQLLNSDLQKFIT